MLIEWFEKIAARSDEGHDAGNQQAKVCWPCVIMGFITFAALAALVYWGIRALIS